MKNKLPLTCRVVSKGDPLEIYTDRDGEVIFKKYSPLGELHTFAELYAETLHKTCLLSVAICDRDGVVACAGLPKKTYCDRRLSSELDSIVEHRSLYQYKPGTERLYLCDPSDGYYAPAVMPIIAAGDVVGCVAALSPGDKEHSPTEAENKLIQSAAGFLARQFED